MENNAISFLVVANKDKPPEGYFLSTLSQAKAKENIKRVTQAYKSSTAFAEEESVRLKNGLLEHKENKEPLMKCSYQEELRYKLVSNSELGNELPKEDCPVALVYAAENDDVELVQEVVKCAGLDILRTTFAFAESGTILHVCTQWSSVNTLEMVLKEYPPEFFDLYSVDVDGDTALHNLPNYWFIEKSYNDCNRAASLLLGFAAVDANKLLVHNNRPDKMTALCKALMYEMPDVCAALLDAARAVEEIPGQTSQKSATEESHWLSKKAYGKRIAAVFKDHDDEEDDADDEEEDEDDGAFCTALHLAIRRGYVNIVNKILEHPGAKNLNLTSLTDNSDNTPLHVAAKVGNHEICAMLLKNGSLESDKARSGGGQSLNKSGETPLHIASAQGNAEVCERLLACGAPPLVRDVHGRYALTNAFHESHLKVVKMLLDACVYYALTRSARGRGKKSKEASKFDINEQLEFGLTLLHVAAAISSFFHVKVLVGAGADINCTCNDHTTPLHRAVGKGARISKKTLTADKESSASSTVEESSDHGSTMKESGEITKEANSPRKLEERSSESTKVLVTDAESSDSTVKESSEATKEANNPRKEEENIPSAVIKESSSEITSKETATNEESSEDKEEANSPRTEQERTDKQIQEVCEMVSFFLNNGAKVDLQDSIGETPLHYAAQYDRGVLRSLLTEEKKPQNFENGRTCDEWICMCNFAGQTALHQLAARVDDPSIGESVELLLSKTSSPKDLLRIRDMEKMTALDLAAQNAQYKYTLIDKMLKANGIDAITKGFLMWSLREHGQVTDANMYCKEYNVDERKNSVLQAAVDEEDVDIARELVNSGADVTALDEDGRTWLVKNLRKAASDQPTLEDTLGRTKLVKAVATLLLSPYTETPVTIGIFGSWGAGKSSFIRQVEEAMLSMSVKEIFRKTRCSPSLDKESSLTKFSRVGNFLRSMVLDALKQRAQKANKSKQKADQESQNLFRGGNYLRSMVLYALKQCKTKANKFEQNAYEEAQIEDDIIFKFPMELQTKYHQLFRSLALTDRSKLVQSSLQARYKGMALHDAGFIAYTPSVLTVQYNAWRYDNKIEASAGLVIEISKQLESFMTPAQWLRMCCKYSWKTHPREILAYFFFPTLISVFVVCAILILWKFVPIATRYKAISLPVGIVSVMLPIIRACLEATQPVTRKLLDLTKSFDHQSMLGYQHQVIDNINFLKDQLCEDAHFGWIVLSFLCKLFISNRYFMEGTWIWRQYPFSSNFRIVVFIDDLDRCDEKIILELLRAISLILGSCGINVVIGVDKDMLHLAITREFLKDTSDNIFDFLVDNKASFVETNTQVLENADGEATLELKDSKSEENGKNSANVDKHLLLSEFADKYLQKIIHLPLQMPEPSKKYIEKFLEGQVGRRSARSKKKQKLKDDPKSIEIVIVGEDLESEDGTNEPIVYRLLLANYTSLEKDMLKYLSQFTTKERDLPREWKRFLNYHRLAWTILSQDRTMKKEEYKGWQRKLIIWIFICWNWRPQMDAIFKNWHEIISKTSKRQAKFQLTDIQQNDGTSMKLRNIIDTYINIMKGNTNEKTSKNMGKQEDEVVSKDGIEVQSLIKDKHDIPLSFVQKFQQEKTSKNRGKHEDEVVSKAWIELQSLIKDKHDIPLNFVKKFQQFRLYCVLNHLEINEQL